MGVVSGGGSGTPFNGGTITAPLTITPVGDVEALRINRPAAVADFTHLIDVRGPGGFTIFQVDGDGGVVVNTDRTATTASPFQVVDGIGDGSAIVLIDDDAANDVVTIGQGGALLLTPTADRGLVLGGPHAAPADGSLAAGQLALWFDQTNGAAKLMLKGKTANGTVASAAIALS